MRGSKAMQAIRWQAGKLELLVGGLSLAFAFVMASLFARRKGTREGFVPLMRVVGAIAAGSAGLLLSRGSGRASRTN